MTQASIACAAEDAGQQGNSSALGWVILMLPTVALFVFFFIIIRRNRNLTLNSLKRFEEHRAFSEAHMRRLEAQVENLDKKLGRLIEVMEAIERGQKRDHT